MTFLLGTGLHRGQITYFFRGQIGSWTPSGIDLGSGGPLDRMRRCLVLPRELWIENFILVSTCTDMYPLMEAAAHAA